MTEKTISQMFSELTTGNVADPNSVCKKGKVFGGTGPTKKQLKQLVRMRIYRKEDSLNKGDAALTKDSLKLYDKILKKF